MTCAYLLDSLDEIPLYHIPRRSIHNDDTSRRTRARPLEHNDAVLHLFEERQTSVVCHSSSRSV